MNFCKQCGKEIAKGKKFCNSSCAAKYNNAHRVRKPWTEEQKKVASEQKQAYYRVPENRENARKAAKKRSAYRVLERDFDQHFFNVFAVQSWEQIRQLLYEGYWDEGLSMSELESKYPCNVRGLFRKLNIPVRSRSETLRLSFLKGKVQPPRGKNRAKAGWFKGIWCDSSWELAFVVYYLDHGLRIERCLDRRKYIFEGKEHIYCPDFITDDGIVELKGYKSPQWEAKLQYNPDVKVLYYTDIKKYVEYAKCTYGQDFVNTLYNLGS